MRNTKTLNMLTKKLIREHSTYKSPIDIFEIIQDIGIECYHRDLEDEMSGFINIKDDRAVIVINENHHQNRQRFTAAHELGHYILHRDVQETFVDKSFKTGLSVKKATARNATFNRDSMSSKGEFTFEIEANRFAAIILMPEELIESKMTQLDIDVTDDDDIKRLAIAFGVSSQAMAFRLASLGVTYF